MLEYERELNTGKYQLPILNNLKLKPQIVPGMTLRMLIKAVMLNDFRIDSACYGRLAFLSGLGVLNSMLGCCETFFNPREIEKVEPEKNPLFIVGHWRSGTTHLHNLISLDRRFSSPTAYQASFPNHFIYSQVANFIFNLIAPPKRPMDEVTFSAEAPHEDEFALAASSLVSPYMKVLFPITGPEEYTSVDPGDWSLDALFAWKKSMSDFVKKMTLSESGRLLFKSPPHMGRIKLLLEMYPEAQFIHIVRNPYDVYLSTRKLWRDSFAHVHLQEPSGQLVQETILNWYQKLFELFERDKKLMDSKAIVEVKYEELDSEPEKTVFHIYETLGLENFESVSDQLKSYVESLSNYRKNSYKLSDQDRELVSSRWRGTFDKYGYTI